MYTKSPLPTQTHKISLQSPSPYYDQHYQTILPLPHLKFTEFQFMSPPPTKYPQNLTKVSFSLP